MMAWRNPPPIEDLFSYGIQSLYYNLTHLAAIDVSYACTSFLLDNATDKFMFHEILASMYYPMQRLELVLWNNGPAGLSDHNQLQSRPVHIYSYIICAH